MDMFAYAEGFNFPHKNELWNLISIYGCGDPELLTQKTKNIFSEIGCRHFLSLDFWDITPEWFIGKDKSISNDAILFDRSHASQILAFLRKIQKEKEDSVLVLHCHAGISRSGAIATFSCDYCGLDYNKFIKKNNHIMANPYVLEVLWNLTRKKPLHGWHDGIDPVRPGTILVPPWAQTK